MSRSIKPRDAIKVRIGDYLSESELEELGIGADWFLYLSQTIPPSASQCNQQMNAYDLIACPCCGGRATIIGTLKTCEWSAICTMCGLETAHMMQPKDAALAWNRRHAPDEEGKDFEELSDAAKDRLGVPFPAPAAEPSSEQPSGEDCGCHNFCEDHGREFIEVTEAGEEYCHECSADGFSGELCGPMAGSCDMRSQKANEFERAYMCPKHAAEHEAFCRESYAEEATPPVEPSSEGVRGLVRRLVRQVEALKDGESALRYHGRKIEANHVKNTMETINELEAALAALSQGEAQQPEAVAWALAFAPDDDRYNGGKCVRLTFDAPSKPIKEWSDTAFTARPLIYGDITPTHDGGGVALAEKWRHEANCLRWQKGDSEIAVAVADAVDRCAQELAALTPAAPQGGK